MHPFDKVTVDGKTVGVSTWVGYSSNEGKMLTLALLDAEFAEPGTEVTFVWGEQDGGSKKPTVERHKQMQIRAIVCPVPYVEVVRKATRRAAGAGLGLVPRPPFCAVASGYRRLPEDQVGGLLGDHHRRRMGVRRGIIVGITEASTTRSARGRVPRAARSRRRFGPSRRSTSGDRRSAPNG